MADKQTDPKQTDFVPHGSDRHASILGLRKATEEDAKQDQYKGWVLKDVTQWGPNARPEFIRAQLIQRVNELAAAPAVPKDAPTIWTP